MKTQELEKEETVQNEETYDVIYKSKLLNKDFTNLDELKKAEADYKLEVAKKEEAKLARKEEALVVQKAIDSYEENKRICNDAIKAAYEEYKAKVAEAEKSLAAYEKEANDKLNEFLKEHPEGFHYTYKSEDGKVTRQYNYYHNRYDVFDSFDEFTKLINNLWFKKF